MTGGELIIEGNVGRQLGAQMRGGVIRVTGSATEHAGFRMRGGMIQIDGPAGRCPGYRMVAGTIILATGPYDHPGLEMRRGTIVCLDHEHTISQNAALAVDGEFEIDALCALQLMLRSVGRDIKHNHWRLFSGDRLELGKGELWQPAV